MRVTFSAARPADAGVVALPVEKDGIDRIPAGVLDDATLALARGAAKAGRFEGEAGGIVEIFVPGSDGANRLVLLGVGSGSEADYERAGGALTARYLTSGVTAIDPFDHRMVRGDRDDCPGRVRRGTESQQQRARADHRSELASSLWSFEWSASLAASTWPLAKALSCPR